MLCEHNMYSTIIFNRVATKLKKKKIVNNETIISVRFSAFPKFFSQLLNKYHEN